MASIGGYRSPVDLGLARTPASQDPEVFDELTTVYNAIHLLNEYLDGLRDEVIGGGSGQAPSESMIFNRFFVGKALMPIPLGSPVCPSAGGGNGIAIGCLANNYQSGSPVSNFCGVALSAAQTGDDVRVGVGPAVLELPGATGGSLIYAYSHLSTAGYHFGDSGLYIGNPGGKSNSAGTSYPAAVAIGIAPGYILFGQALIP